VNDSPPAQRSFKLRYVLYSAIVCVGFFALLNWAIESLEDRGVVDTHDPDDQVQHLTERIWERRGDRWVTTTYGSEHFVQDSFAVDRTGPRVFLTGGSWALGTPYSYQGSPPAPGSMHSFLEAWLRAELGPGAELVNAAAGGQDSHRVVQVVQEAVAHSPDILVVATCNNEGALTPARLQGWLKEQGGYRLLERILASNEEPARTVFTAQAKEIDRVAAAYEANLEAIATASREAQVPLVLATLPQHLLYQGLDDGQDPEADRSADYWTIEPTYQGSLPEPSWIEQVNPCLAVLALLEAGEWELSLAMTKWCLTEHSLGPKSVEVARARMHLGRGTDDDRRVLGAFYGPCVAQGMRELRDDKPEAAIRTLSACEGRIDEALRWNGIAHGATGDLARARELLRHSVELNPRNRCRPSFNQIAREVAARHSHVTLADLEYAAEQLAPNGLPGHELFLDSCHMNWRGYGSMAKSLAVTLGPMLGADPASLDPEALGVSWGLPRGDAVDQIVFAYSDGKIRLDDGP